MPDGKVLVAGGFGNGGGPELTAELFDPATDTFTALPASGNTQLQAARFPAVAASLPDGQVLIAGGQNGGAGVQSAELFDPAADTFTALPASGNTELQTARSGAVAAALPNGQVLIAGGSATCSTDLQSAELYVLGAESSCRRRDVWSADGRPTSLRLRNHGDQSRRPGPRHRCHFAGRSRRRRFPHHR